MNYHCLIVDDNPQVRETIARLVEHITGCPTRSCSNGSEALQVFGNEPERYACVVTDLNMPGIDGLNLGKLLRELAPSVKLVLITANAGTLNGDSVRESGFSCVLQKPFTLHSLRDALRSVLEAIETTLESKPEAPDGSIETKNHSSEASRSDSHSPL